MKCVQIKNFSSDVYEVYKQAKDVGFVSLINISASNN